LAVAAAAAFVYSQAPALAQLSQQSVTGLLLEHHHHRHQPHQLANTLRFELLRHEWIFPDLRTFVFV
jgi:hypothetical protein